MAGPNSEIQVDELGQLYKDGNPYEPRYKSQDFEAEIDKLPDFDYRAGVGVGNTRVEVGTGLPMKMLKEVLKSFARLGDTRRNVAQGFVNPLDVANVLGGPGPKGAVGVFGGRPMAGAVSRSARGKLLYEIGDEGMTLKTTNITEAPMKLVDVIDHPELFKAYPELRNLTVRGDQTLQSKAMLNSDAGLNAESFSRTPGEIVIKPSSLGTPEGFKESLVHELQHAVQITDNITSGGRLRGERSTGTNVLDAGLDAKLAYDKLDRMFKQNKMNLSDEQLDTFARLNEGIYDYHAYLANPGEIEANVASARMNMSQAERVANAPNFRIDPLEGRKVMDLESIIARPKLPGKPSFGQRPAQEDASIFSELSTRAKGGASHDTEANLLAASRMQREALSRAQQAPFRDRTGSAYEEALRDRD